MNRQPLQFAIFGNAYQTKKSASIRHLLDLLHERGADVYIDSVFYNYLKSELHFDFVPKGLIETDDFEADFVISMGGDGTFLQAASRVGEKEYPIFGINTGRLGYMADVRPSEIVGMIESIYKGQYEVESRSILQLTSRKHQIKGHPFALNEIAVLKRDDSSMITIRAEIDGKYIATYRADGLLVSTPTGSTGYALSVGGPIVVPQSNSFILTAVAPHSLNMRPIVVRDDAQIVLTVESRNHNFLIAIDGRSETCSDQTVLFLQKAPYNVRMLKRSGQSYFNTLRHKLMWGADNRE